MSNDISVLMSTYKKDDPHYLFQALKSLEHQTLQPTEIVLVEDGHIPPELSQVIQEFRTILNIKSVCLEKNQGLAIALNEGLKHCSYDLIARMDADDISEPTRFEEQLSFMNSFKEVDIVGSWIKEFTDDSKQEKIVKYPQNHEMLLVFFRKRDPLAHPSVMFRKSFFEKAGIYNIDMKKDQDTDLWFRGFLHGAVFANIPRTLLKFRLSTSTLNKRKDIHRLFKYYKLRIKVNSQLKLGLSSYLYVTAYVILQLLPTNIKKHVYQYIR